MFRAQVDRMFEDSLEGLSFDEKLQTRELLENYNDPMEGVGKHNFSQKVFTSAIEQRKIADMIHSGLYEKSTKAGGEVGCSSFQELP